MSDDNEKFTDETFVRIYDDKTGDYWQSWTGQGRSDCARSLLFWWHSSSLKTTS
jgi:hypothetical protein